MLWEDETCSVPRMTWNMCDIKSSRCVNAMGADGSDHGVDLCTTERPQHPHNHCLRSGRGRTTTSGETESPTVATCATATPLDLCVHPLDGCVLLEQVQVHPPDLCVSF